MPFASSLNSALFSRHQPGGLFSINHVLEHAGEVFFVDGDASNAADVSGGGKQPDKPFATLKYAVTQCSHDQGDTILVAPSHSETVTETIAFNKRHIRVLGLTAGSMNPMAAGEYSSVLADASFTDGPVATVTAPCWIEGLAFVSRDTGGTFYSGAAMLIGGQSDATPFGVIVRRCRFPKWNVDNRIGIAIEGGTDPLVEHCLFEGVGADLDAGVYFQGALQNPIFRYNYFRQCTAAFQCGAFAGGGPHAFIHTNFVEDGKLLDTQGNAGTGLIADNYLETATDTSSYDRSVATLQGDGWQFSGNHYSE